MAPFASAANPTLQLYPLTGEMRLLNPSSTPVQFVFYEIKSTSGGLNGASGVWTSIADTYDASGNGFIDPVNNWTELSSISTDLSEGVLFGSGGSLLAFRSIGLGRIWNPNIAAAANLVPTIALAQGQNVVPMDKQLAVDGNFNNDLRVDQQDYAVWHIVFGSTNFPMADGNHDGLVDAADYTVWRDHLGAALALGTGAFTAAAVPEPSTRWLLFAGGLAMCAWRRRCYRNSWLRTL
jgi:hypothetical protein